MQRWWLCLRKTKNQTITKQVYCLMLSKLCVLLLKETWTDPQLDAQVRRATPPCCGNNRHLHRRARARWRAAERQPLAAAGWRLQWREDAKNRPEMDQPLFFEKLYDIVEMWCTGQSEQEAIEFLDRTRALAGMLPLEPPSFAPSEEQ